MRELVNNLSREQAEAKLLSEKFERVTVSMYRYVLISDPEAMRDQLFREWKKLGVLGRTYVATEGINAQINVPEHNWDKFVDVLYSHPEFVDIPFKIGIEQHESFVKLAIKTKKQIVADGLTMQDYDITNVGEHLEPEDFHEALQNPDVIVVDMRNGYESRIGHFDNALCLDVDTFREQLPLVKEGLKGKEDEEVLLYCTGGIRCEKTSAYLKHHGFKNVKQLYGGIINYAHRIKQLGLDSKFKGKNYVFDDRIAERITEDVLTNCDQCGNPNDDHTNCANVMCNLLFIQCTSCKEKMSGACTIECKRIFELPEHDQRELRKKQPPTNHDIFKSRLRPNLSI